MKSVQSLCKGGTARVYWVVLLFYLLALFGQFADAKPATQPEQLAENQIGFSTQSDQRRQLMDVADYFKLIEGRPLPSTQVDDLNSTSTTICE